MVVFWRLSCFAVSVRQAILTLEELNGLGIDFVRYQDGLDSGAAMFKFVAALAELERLSARELAWQVAIDSTIPQASEPSFSRLSP